MHVEGPSPPPLQTKKRFVVTGSEIESILCYSIFGFVNFEKDLWKRSPYGVHFEMPDKLS